jgi:hypothetical protein
MHFDSFSLGARHLFQKLVLFFFMSSYTCDTLLFLELKSLSELLIPFEKKYFDSLVLKPLEPYVNLLSRPAAYQKPSNLVYIQLKSSDK